MKLEPGDTSSAKTKEAGELYAPGQMQMNSSEVMHPEPKLFIKEKQPLASSRDPLGDENSDQVSYTDGDEFNFDLSTQTLCSHTTVRETSRESERELERESSDELSSYFSTDNSADSPIHSTTSNQPHSAEKHASNPANSSSVQNELVSETADQADCMHSFAGFVFPKEDAHSIAGVAFPGEDLLPKEPQLATDELADDEMSDEEKDEDDEERDELRGLRGPATGNKNSKKRISTVSVASSIAALAPLIWGSRDDDKDGHRQGQDLLPNDADCTPEIITGLDLTEASSTDRDIVALTYYHGGIKRARATPPNESYKRKSSFGMAAQAVADWESSLDSFFDSCLGNLLRFQLEEPELCRPANRAMPRNDIRSRFKSWRRISHALLSSITSNTANSTTQSGDSEQKIQARGVHHRTEEPTKPGHIEISTQTLSSASSSDWCAGEDTKYWPISKSCSPIISREHLQASKRSRFYNFLKSLIAL